MIDRKTAIEQKQFVSTKISDLARFICFGLMAIFYSLVTTDSTFGTSIVRSNHVPLYIMAIGAAAAILLDYLQYLCGYFNSSRALAVDSDEISFPKDIFLFGRYACFYIKQVLTLVSSALLLFMLATTRFPVG